MRRLLVTLAAVLPAVLPLRVRAQEGGPAGAPTGITVTASLAAGGELGLDQGKAGVFELEGAVGYELASGLRPELAIALGVAPDDHVALRPGVRFALPNLPIQLRAALDAANSRGASGLDWRWLLLGVAAEVRWTSLLGLYAEVDTGARLSSKNGLPLLLRAGASFRF
jgi:hypothetical protein